MTAIGPKWLVQRGYRGLKEGKYEILSCLQRKVL